MNRVLLNGLMIALLWSSIAWAATPGVNDVVTYVRVGTGAPNCLFFQTQNQGGTVGVDMSATIGWYGVGVGTGTNSLQNVAADVLNKLTSSRVGQTGAPLLQFELKTAGFYGDCPSPIIGVDKLAW